VKRAQEIAAGLFSLSTVALNVVWHVQHGRWFESFWLCNLSLGLVGLGLLSRSRLPVNVGFVWLLPGTLAWASEAAFLGGSFAPTSYLVHLAGTALAAFGVARLGVHRRTELAALAFLCTVLLLARCLPASANVNCAFGARSGWSLLPEDAALFFGCGALLALVTSILSTWLARRLIRRPSAHGAPNGAFGSESVPVYGAGLAPP
jgi:hypothetical protein